MPEHKRAAFNRYTQCRIYLQASVS